MTPESIIALDGVVQPISEHALDYGIPAALIVARLHGGWDTREAIETPMPVPGDDIATDDVDREIRRQERNLLDGLKRQARQAQRETKRNSTREHSDRLQALRASERALKVKEAEVSRLEREQERDQKRSEREAKLQAEIAEREARLHEREARLQARLAKLQHIDPAIGLMKQKRAGPVAQTLTHAGETLTVKQWSERTGVNPHTIAYRLRQGWTVAEALSGAKTFGPEGILHTHDGKTMCVRAWSRHTGIAAGTINYRLRKGMSIGEAINAPINARFRPKGYAPSAGRPGVGQNLAQGVKTGGVSFAHDRPELEFSE